MSRPTGFDPITDGVDKGKVQNLTNIVIQDRFSYEGLFVISELYKMIDDFFEEKGYDKLEQKNAEVVRDDGVRFIEIILRPWKKITDYAQNIIKMRMIIENAKEVEVKKEGVKTRAHHGKVSFVFDVWMSNDHEERWAKNTMLSIIRIMFERFFMKHYTKQYIAECLDDYKMLIYQIKTYLNMHQS